MSGIDRRMVVASLALGLAVSGMGLPIAGHAGVTVVRKTQFGGFMGMGANDTQSTEYIQGQKKRDESTFKFTGSILSKFAGPRSSVTIYRPDKNQIVRLDPQKHSYTVEPMTVANVQQAMGSRGEAGKSGTASGGTGENMRVVRNELTVKATGAHKRINDFPCKEYRITWLLEVEDTQTKARAKSLMTSDIWAAPETSALRSLKAEEAAYSNAYLKRLGLKLSPQQAQQFGLGVVGAMTGSSQKDLKAAMSKIKGYPIEVSVKWQSNAKSASGGSSADNGVASAEAALKSAAGAFGGLFGGSKHHKKAASGSGGDMQTIFSSTTQIVKVKTENLSSAMFDIPKGYHRER